MPIFNQLLCTLIVSFFLFLSGTLFTWTSYTAKLLMSEDTPLARPMSPYEISLVGALPCVGGIVMNSIIGIIIDKFGRKRSTIVFVIPSLLAWLIIINTTTIRVVYVAIFMAGLTLGAAQVLVPIFISEIAEVSIKGTLGAAPVFGYSLGALTSYVYGGLCSYFTVLYLNLGFSIFLIVTLMYVKETPKYLLMKGHDEEALKSLAFYRNSSIHLISVQNEFEAMKRDIKTHRDDILYQEVNRIDENKNEKGCQGCQDSSDKKKSTWKIFMNSKSTQRALAMMIVLMACAYFMGLIAIQVYAGTLFAKTTPDISSHLCSIILGVVLTFSCVITMLVSDKLGRRVLLMLSSVGCSICMALIGSLIQFAWGPQWLIPLFICLFCFFYNLGGGTVPMSLVSEIFLPEIASFASVIVMGSAWFYTFVQIMIFNVLVDLLEIHGLFYFFSVICGLTVIFTYFAVPETKGLTVYDIQEKFYSKAF